MTLLDNMFDKIPKQSNREPQHAVIIWFDYGLENMEPLYELSDKLERIIKTAGVGEFDGHEIAMDNSDGSVYMYGPNAEVLFTTILPILNSTPFMEGAIAKLRFGPPGEGAHEIDLKL